MTSAQRDFPLMINPDHDDLLNPCNHLINTNVLISESTRFDFKKHIFVINFGIYVTNLLMTSRRGSSSRVFFEAAAALSDDHFTCTVS